MTEKDKMQELTYRKSVFHAVFGTESGKLVLEYLTNLYEIKSVDTENSNKVYLQLGKQQVIQQIKLLSKGE